MNKKKCNNCSRNFDGNYCSHCGQRSIANERLNFKVVFNDFLDNVFNIHKGLIHTFWRLIINPGEVGRQYIEGRRKMYTNPVRYLIIAIAIQAFLDYWFIHPEMTKKPDFINFAFLSENLNESMALWNHTLATKYSLVHNLSMILIFPATFLFLFRKQRYNFTELLTINFYFFSNGLILTVTSIFLFLQVAALHLPIPIIIAITMSYVIWTNMSFFNEVAFWKRISKIIIAMLIFMIFRVYLMVYLLSLFFPIK